MDRSDFVGLVARARSYRRYVEADPIPAEVVRGLVEVARVVPSAANQQPLRYRIVTEEGERARLFPYTKWAGALKDWGGPKEGERPTAYIMICADKTKNVATDVGIAAQTMQLAATAAGYAACMLGAIDRDGLKTAFAIPEPLAVQLVVALGRPGETIVLEEAGEGGSVAYYRTGDGVHHVPKRGMGEILLG